MKRNLAVLFAFMFMALVFALVGYTEEMGAKCSLCGMNIAGNENTAYEITYTDGTVETYCCPHCGLYEHATKKDGSGRGNICLQQQCGTGLRTKLDCFW